ncbi:MAG: TolC family protein [Bacteroidales bacterium]|nr:TolC family protein [Bacteroidales bacterium]MDD4002412.1 TolC family protein [Bacteroidales bacterium]MDD4529564.1 TolC family protein [Bacteroidales bacterium]
MLKKNTLRLFIIIIFLSIINNSYSQDSIFNSIYNDKYADLVLPPVDTLFYYAEKNPNIEIYKYRELEQKSNIKSEKRGWLKYSRFSSSYQYGYQGAESLIQGQLIPAFYQNYQKAQNLYHIGVAIAVPFDEIIDRKNKITKQKNILEQLKYERNIKIENQKLIIVELYNKANEYISLLKIRYEAKEFAQVLSMISQRDFVNGKATLNELSIVKHSESVASGEFETVRNELKINLMKLEIICNYKFPIIKNL